MLPKEADRLAFLQAAALGALDPDEQQHLVAEKRGVTADPSLRPYPVLLNQSGWVFQHLAFNFLEGGQC